MPELDKAREIARFQVSIGRKWCELATLQTEPALAFSGYFSAFNAIFWLWGYLDDLRSFTPDQVATVLGALSSVDDEELRNSVMSRVRPGLPGDQTLIKRLITKLEAEAVDVITRIMAPAAGGIAVTHMKTRDPIRRMDDRTVDQDGDPKEGRKHRNKLETGSAVEHCQALAGISYIARCNLVHGSKAFEIDRPLLVALTPFLQTLSEESIAYTERWLDQNGTSSSV